MILGWLRRSANNRVVIERLYDAIVTAARQRPFYVGYGVPDTFEGRFECLTVHAVLVLRRLGACEAPGPDIAQALVDTVFRHFDRTLREMGVGDSSVPKRMKTLAEAFLGRSAAYAEALAGGSATLSAALARNVYAERANADRANADRLARYVEEAVRRLDGQPLQILVDGGVAFPDPARFIEEPAR